MLQSFRQHNTSASMASATFPFRPPQFSDDVAWLPAWLQPIHSQSTLQEQIFRNTPQDVDPFKGENSQVKEPDLLTNRENGYNIGQLYLSGEDSSTVTATPSCEKVLHFNLHLSIDGTSSIISNPGLHTAQDHKINSTCALVGTREESQCNIGHASSNMNNLSSPSSEKYSNHFAELTQSSNDNGKNNVEIMDPNFDDISDAVELSIAASEALVLHKMIRSGSFSDALSTSEILEVALQVKQARLDELKDSSYCLEDFDNTTDILSDLGDSDMEDAYKDVGLSVNSLVNISPKDPSTSRVKETPMSDISGEENEVQCEWQGDQDIFSERCFAIIPQENNQKTDKSTDLPAEISGNEMVEKLCNNPSLDLICLSKSQNGNLDDLDTLQEDKNDTAYADVSPHHQPENKFHHQSQHPCKRQDSISGIWHSHYADINEVNNRSSSRFQSRWFGGWTGTEGDACGELKSKGRKTVPKFFTGETSYLSESIDNFPDQSSVVRNQHPCSNTVEYGKPIEDSCNTASNGAFESQEVVKDSASFVDPLCSMVPCSISAQIGDSFPHINNNDDHPAFDVFKCFPTGTETPKEIAQTANSGQYGENVGKEKHGELDFDDVSPYPVFRQFTSLKTLSTVLPGNSAFSFMRNSNGGYLSLGENYVNVLSEPLVSYRQSSKRNTRHLSHTSKDSTKSPDYKDTAQQPHHINRGTAKSNQEDQDMNLLLEEQCITSTKEKGVSRKQLPIKSIFSCTTAINNIEDCVENACGLVQDKFQINDVQLQVNVEDIPTSPLVLCHRTRRLKAPKPRVIDVSAANLLVDEAPTSDKVCHEVRQISQNLHRNLLIGDVPARKRVRFSDVDSKHQIPQGQFRKNLKKPSCKNRSSCRFGDRPEEHDQEQGTASQEVKERLTKCRMKGRKRTVFQGLDFLLTGFSKKKEKEIEGLLRKHGGMVLSDIPATFPHSRRRRSLRYNAERLPVILCTKKLQTTRFLYGCAVNAFLLKIGWAYDSIRLSSVLPPDKYIILTSRNNRMQNQIGKSMCQNDNDYIFNKVGIMLHGTHSFCTKFAKVIKHGRGQVYKSLQWLVQSLENKKISLGAIVAEDENRATRHLKKCASEQKIVVMSVRWLINSLSEGKLLPLKENHNSSKLGRVSAPEVSVLLEGSQEI